MKIVHTVTILAALVEHGAWYSFKYILLYHDRILVGLPATIATVNEYHSYYLLNLSK